MKWLQLNITRKFLLLLLLFGFLVLQLVQLGISEYGVLHVGAEGAMINDAGKQRTRTLLVGKLARAALAPGASGANDRQRLALTTAEYEKEFVALEGILVRPHSRRMYAALRLVDREGAGFERARAHDPAACRTTARHRAPWRCPMR